MKKIMYLLLTCLILIGCNKQETRTNDTEYHQSNFESQLNDSLKAIEFLKEFYLTFYGVDEIKKNRKELLKNYVSSRILKKMDSLSQEDNLVIDYDPFIQGQDYNSESIKKNSRNKTITKSK